MANTNPGDIKIGNIIAYNGGRYRVLKSTHVKPGKGGAFYQMEMKEITVGTKLIERIRSEDKLDKLETSVREFTFSYISGDIAVIMDENFEETEVSADLFGEFSGFLEYGMNLKAEYVGEDLVNIKMPLKLIGEVAETEVKIKNATATAVYKPATLTNGFVLDIPPYIENGDKIIINSETGEFVEKYKE